MGQHAEVVTSSIVTKITKSLHNNKYSILDNPVFNHRIFFVPEIDNLSSVILEIIYKFEIIKMFNVEVKIRVRMIIY